MGEDVTVKAGSDGEHSSNRLDRIYEQALEFRNPFIYFGQAAGSRIPDILGSEGLTKGSGMRLFGGRQRRIPQITMIVGRSFGESSFIAAMSDLILQVRDTTMAVTSPRVIEVATGETVTDEELGGPDVHARTTGQVDLVVDSPQDGMSAIRELLGYLPSNCWELPPRDPGGDTSAEFDNAIAELVPADRRRAYDVKRVIRRLVDGGSLRELQPKFGRSLLTALARIGGLPVGLIASQPIHNAGALTPAACDKMTRFVCLCDGYNIPLVFLADSPGFLVGVRAEHERFLFKGMLTQSVLALARVPRITVVLRKAFGLSYFALSGSNMGSSLLCAWPGAEIGFMDPDVGANVLHARELAALEPQERAARTGEYAEALRAQTTPYGAAAQMGIDEIIHPGETRSVLLETLLRLERTRTPGPGVLSSWPTCW
jgi:acetyl-CoA carboxylase carboxyltransferase component